MATNSPSYQAAGNIYPARAVKQSAEYTVVQCGDNEQAVGIGQLGKRKAPGTAADDGYAAISGSMIQVCGLSEVCRWEAGSAINAGQYLASDSDGKARPFTSSDVYAVARAQETCTAAGAFIQVQVILFADDVT